MVSNMCWPRIFSDGTALILSAGSPIPYIRLCGDHILLVGVLATLDTIDLLQNRWLHDGCSSSGMVIKNRVQTCDAGHCPDCYG
jgi:hypothetical protein